MATCGYSYYQHYITGHRSRQHAAAWFGGEIVHRIVQTAYHGLPLAESFEQVWQQAIGPILPDLQAWFDLDRDYRRTIGGKRSDSKDAVAWRAANPSLAKLREKIDTYQRTVLAYLRWNERTGLADYYRRSTLLLEVDPSQVLLPNPWLVEGQWLTSDEDTTLIETPTEAPGDVTEEDEEKGRTFTLLQGVIGDISVCGVPDVVAMRGDGIMLVGDYKTNARPLTSREIATNTQLVIYCELLRQNGILQEGQEVLVGHIYLTENAITQIWADTNLHSKRLPLIERQLLHAESKRQHGDFVPVAGLLPTFLDPCSSCDMAHVCDARLTLAENS
jgi:hypothetical protein